MIKNNSKFPTKNFGNEENYSLIQKNIDEHDSQHMEQNKHKQNYGTTSTESQLSSSDDEKGSTDSTAPYPIAVIFVLLSKTFEAFAANGVRSVLALFLRDSLKFDEEFSTAFLHTFNFFSQFLPMFGACLADSYLGNAQTIFLFCVPYAIGYVGTFLGTLPYAFATHSLIYVSLLLISIGNGCLRACITALGGHQFKLPQQRHSLEQYFALYYFFYYFGILLGKIIPAYIRKEVQIETFCEEQGQCYTAVFGIITISFFISWLIFLFGLSFYKPENPSGDNTMLKVAGCISFAIYKKALGRSKHISWMQGSIGKYSVDFVKDVTMFLKVVTLFTPMPIYYALLAQQDSSWTFQATQTNTTVFGITLQADQFKAVGPILLMILIPIWQKLLIPLMERYGFQLTPLESVSIGGLCAAFSFICAGVLQHRIFNDPDNPPTILWQFPMFFLIMLAEVLISVPGLQFCYTHAPSSMKTVLTAVWFINNALGNGIVVIFTELRLIENKSVEFFFYAFLMFAGTVAFTMLSENFNSDEAIVSDDQTLEAYNYVDKSSNLEENFLDDNTGDADSDY